MKVLTRYLKPYSFPLITAVILLFVQAYTNLALPDFMSDIVNIGIQKRGLAEVVPPAMRDAYAASEIDTGGIQMGFIIHTGMLMLLYTGISALAAVSTGFLSARIASGFARDVRSAVFEHVENFSASEFDRFSTASLITRTSNDVMQLQTLMVMLVTMVFYAPIIAVGGIIRAVGKSHSMWWIIALAVAVLITLIFSIYKISLPKFSLMQKLMDRLNLVSRETLSGMMVIRSFNREGYEQKRFEKVNKDLTETMLFVNRVTVVMMPVMMFIMNGISIMIIWIGAKQIASSSMLVGDMMAFMQYVMQIVSAFFMLSMMFIMFPRAAVSARRIAEVLSLQPSISDPVSPGEFRMPFSGTVEFRNVSFRYPGAEENAVSDISFTARPGETTALIGTTGSGKSTLVHLINRFYDVSDGMVLVGGKDVREVRQHDLRSKISSIAQKSVLFSGTVAENLRYGDEDAPEEILENALRTAQAGDFVAGLSGGMKGEISQGGKNLSGGQKQRLAIGRALVKKAPIYIFDDSFSALDFQTDARLRRELKVQLNSATLIIVAQRISTIKDAEKIIVLDKGKVIGEGTHNELMERCSVYREIAEVQLSAEKPA
jgi:ATP-binding cassette subfamily B protein